MFIEFCIAAAVAAVFLPTGLNVEEEEWEWVLTLDDRQNYVENTRIQEWSRENVAWMWLEGDVAAVYEPLSLMLKIILHSMFGLEARLYLLFGIGFHCLNAALLYRVANSLLLVSSGVAPSKHAAVARRLGCGVGAIIFAVHPLRTETIGWLSCQPYFLAAFFALVGMECYLRSLQERCSTRRWRWLACLLFCASSLSKSAALSLPAVLICFDVFVLRWSRCSSVTGVLRTGLQSLWEHAPFFVSSLLLVFKALVANAKYTHTYATDGSEGGSVFGAVLQAGYSVAWYATTTLNPFPAMGGPTVLNPTVFQYFKGNSKKFGG
jgi:hypothetical protein